MSYTDIFKTSIRQAITNLDDIPFVNRSLVDYENYNRFIGQAMVKDNIVLLATRGCPYKCFYCHNVWSKKHNIRSAENIFEEVYLYYKMGVRRFVFIDDIFNLDRENSMRFYRLIIKNGLKVQLFFPNGLRGDILSKDYIDLMVEAGTVNISLALETGSPRIQKLIRKNLNIEKFRENLHYACKNFPEVIIELQTMHGFPSETEEEAMMTLDFIFDMKWLDFPYINILKIFPKTEMEKLAIENGVSKADIAKSRNLTYDELPATLPFDKSFSYIYQAKFLHEYFLSKERLLYVLPHQMKLLTEDELMQKYNSYLPGKFNRVSDLLEVAGISEGELNTNSCLPLDHFLVPDLNEKILECFPVEQPEENAFKILLLDLSLFFKHDRSIIYDVVELPIGLMYLMSYLKQQMGKRVKGKIAKSRIDFQDYDELKTMLEDFNPDLIGIRTLTLFKDFFHFTAALIREWGFNIPIITGGPYATSDYLSILQDPNVDLVVIGEGEITLCELVTLIIENKGELPCDEVLKKIPGMAFVPGNRTRSQKHLEVKGKFDTERVAIEIQQKRIKHFNDDLENE